MAELEQLTTHSSPRYSIHHPREVLHENYKYKELSLNIITKVGGIGTRAHIHMWHRGGLRHRQATNWSPTTP
jgi:hypothetical protein